jgi:ABC-2 type transport system permease protein
VFGLFLGVEFFQGYSPLQVVISLLGIMLFVAVFAIGFLFFSAAISITMETPEGLQGIITLLTMPIFFASNALYPVSAFPPLLQAVSVINPLSQLINGIRYFAIGDNFSAIGIHYVYTTADILLSFGILALFSGLMFVVAWWRFKVAVVT